MAGHAGDAAREIAEVRSDLPELVGRALELAERASLVNSRARHVLRAFSVAARDLRDARHPLPEPPNLRFLNARCVSNSLSPRETRCSRFDDLVERRARGLR